MGYEIYLKMYRDQIIIGGIIVGALLSIDTSNIYAIGFSKVNKYYLYGMLALTTLAIYTYYLNFIKQKPQSFSKQKDIKKNPIDQLNDIYPNEMNEINEMNNGGN